MQPSISEPWPGEGEHAVVLDRIAWRVRPEFDESALLISDEVVAAYPTTGLEDDDPDVFLAAVGHVAKARAMSAIAERADLGRESLHKAFAPGAKPRYDTVLKLLHSLGVKLTVSAA